MTERNDDATLNDRAIDILQQLIRFNTTNPPGHERACIQYIQSLLEEAGIESTIVAAVENRPNLIARIKGQGTKPPLLLYGHVDVVGTEGQKWSHPPFAGEIHDEQIWGRGALDMKGGIAMLLAAFLRAHTQRTHLQGDVIFAIVSDEEAGGTFGAKYLVEQHAHFFEHVRYAIGEFGGFSIHVGKQKFYPIMVAEKQVCWTRVRLKGAGGHGSLAQQGGSVDKLTTFLHKLNREKLPVYITPATRMMIEAMAAHLPTPAGFVLRRLLQPSLTNATLALLGEKGSLFAPLLRNTVNVTIIRGGEKINVIPSEIELQLDARLLPGFTPEQFFQDLRRIVGQDIELELIHYDPVPHEPDMGMFGLLSELIKEADPEGVAVPLILPGGTDGRFFSKLGIQTYGFLPMNLPEELKFTSLIHAADERVPLEAIRFGTETLYRLLQRYDG
jgi:acetylornithine deacetylase/succinyl-diaminopimelate desuccinylase-like protein